MTNPNELNHNLSQGGRPQDELPQPFRAAVDAILAEPTPDIDLTHFVSDRPMPATLLSNRRRPKRAFLKTMNDIPWVLKPITVVALAAAVIVLCLIFSNPAGSSIALAQVAAKIENARTLSYLQTIEPLDGKTPKIITRFTSLGADKTRTESHSSDPEHDMVSIYDYAAGKQIYLYTAKKEALITTIKGRPTPEENDANRMLNALLEDMKKRKRQTPSLGHKLIDGVECIGFGDDKCQTWVDAKTGNLVLWENDDLHTPQGAFVPQGVCKLVQSDFKIDEKVDPALFSLEPPEGYKVIQNPWVYDFSKTPAQLATSILRTYAENMDGQFPARLADEGESIYADFKKKGVLDKKEWEMDGVKNSDLRGTIWQLNNFFLLVEPGSEHENYEYYPGGKLGEKDRIVFWYKDKESGEYTAVYGDLRAEKIDQEKLPPPLHDSKE